MGDNPEADIAAAAAAGIDSVWLSRGRVWTVVDYTPTAIADNVITAISIATG